MSKHSVLKKCQIEETISVDFQRATAYML